MIVALEAAASCTSFSVMPPMPRRTKLSFTSSRSSRFSDSVTASSEPCTSALSTMLSVAVSPREICSKRSSSLAPGRGGHRLVARQPEALGPGLAERAGPGQVLGRPHLVAGVRRLGEAEHLHRRRGQRLLDVVALVVDQRLDLAPGRAGHDRVADAQRALLHDHGRHRAAAGLEVRLEHDAACLALDARRQLLHLGHEHDLLEQVVDPGALQRRDLDRDGVAAPRLGHELALGELLEHPRPGRRRAGRSC